MISRATNKQIGCLKRFSPNDEVIFFFWPSLMDFNWIWIVLLLFPKKCQVSRIIWSFCLLFFPSCIQISCCRNDMNLFVLFFFSVVRILLNLSLFNFYWNIHQICWIRTTKKSNLISEWDSVNWGIPKCIFDAFNILFIFAL